MKGFHENPLCRFSDSDSHERRQQLIISQNHQVESFYAFLFLAAKPGSTQYTMGCLPSRPQPSSLAGSGHRIPISDIVSFALDRQHLYNQNKPLFIDADDPILSLSASQTIALVSRLVAGLRAAGLKKGDVVLLHLGNHVSTIPVLLLCVVLSALHYALHPSQRRLQKWSPTSPFFPVFSLLIPGST